MGGGQRHREREGQREDGRGCARAQVCYNSATALLGWSSSFLFVERTFPAARRASTVAMLDRSPARPPGL